FSTFPSSSTMSTHQASKQATCLPAATVSHLISTIHCDQSQLSSIAGCLRLHDSSSQTLTHTPRILTPEFSPLCYCLLPLLKLEAYAISLSLTLILPSGSSSTSGNI